MLLLSVTSPTADPGVASFLEIDHEIISMVILLLLLIQEGMLSVVSYKQKYVYKVLVKRLVKLAQEKVWLGLDMTIAVD